jgi:hypothetical protein
MTVNHKELGVGPCLADDIWGENGISLLGVFGYWVDISFVLHEKVLMGLHDLDDTPQSEAHRCFLRKHHDNFSCVQHLMKKLEQDLAKHMSITEIINKLIHTKMISRFFAAIHTSLKPKHVFGKDKQGDPDLNFVY